MKRIIFPVLLGWLALTASASAQRVDTVYTLDKTTGKEKATEGKIKAETPSGITIQGKTDVTIPALEVRHVFYTTAVTAIDYRKPFNLLDKAANARTAPQKVGLLQDALTELKALEPQIGARGEATRYVKYRMATTLVQLAEIEASKPERMDAAIAALVDYKTTYPIGWEIVPALKRLAELQEQKKDVAGALKAYEELGAVDGLPKAMKQRSDILVARLYLRTDKPKEAEQTLARLRKSMEASDPQRPEVEINLVESQLDQKKLDEAEELVKSALAATTDVGLKARAFNYLGDYYRLKGSAEDALWQYLRVETVYNQNVQERAKALYWLSQLFGSVLNDRGRATECADKLRGPQFADTPYPKQLPPKATEGR